MITEGVWTRPATEGKMRERVVIVGGGIGGLALAIALRRRGILAPVYEAAPELRPIGAGIWVPPNAMQVLGRLGLAEAVMSLFDAAEVRQSMLGAATQAACNGRPSPAELGGGPAPLGKILDKIDHDALLRFSEAADNCDASLE